MDPIQQQAMIQALLAPALMGQSPNAMPPSTQPPMPVDPMGGGLPNPMQQQLGGPQGMMGMMPPGLNGPPAAYTGY